MHIAVDARELCGRPTGVGRYLGALLDEWAIAPAAGQHTWSIYAHEMPRVPHAFAGATRIVRGSGGTKWQQWDLPKALDRNPAGVLFAPGYSAPLRVSCPTVVTIHDVSYFDHPEWFSAREGTRLRWFTRWSARRARAVLTDSEFSRQRILHHLELPTDRVRLVRLGIRPPGGQPAGRSRREPIVLFVGSIFERRRVDWLIQGFDDVVARVPEARLEIVGENRTVHPRRDLEALRRQSAHADRIALRSYVDEAVLADLYARASVFAFLSEYEGFGLTPLEALAAGIPPVVLDTAVAHEVCGPAARYIAADAARSELVGALVELLTDQARRAAILEQAAATLARYDWSDTAKATLAAIEEAANGIPDLHDV